MCYARRSVGQSTQILFTLAKGAAHAALSNKQRKCAFTLAEVLITLGIIGVVAAMTLSTVISKIQDKQNIAKWKKEYSVISNAFNEVVADGVTICNHTQYGHCHGQGYTDEFVDAIQKKLRVVDYCGSASVFPREKICDYTNFQNGDWWKKYGIFRWSGINGSAVETGYKALGESSSSNNGVNRYNFSRIALLLADGASVYLGTLWNGPWIVVDVNNFNNGPNQFGRDVFVIHVSSDIKKNKHYLAPAGSESLFDEIPALNNADYGITGCSKDIGKPSSNTVYEVAGSGCSAKYLLE